MRPGDEHRAAGGRRGRVLSACLLVLLAALVLAASSAASSWTLRQLPPPTERNAAGVRVSLNAVSCPTTSLCVTVGSLNTVASSRAPTGGVEQWHVVHPTLDEPIQKCVEERWETSCYDPRGSLEAVSCPTEELCVAVGHEGSVYVSTEPSGGAQAWRVTDVNGRGGATHLTSVSCPSASLCVAVSGGYGGAGGRVLTSTDPASRSWQAASLGDSADLRAVSCATTSLCVAVAKDGRIFASTDPTAGASAWRQAGSPTPRDLEAVSCVATLLCAAGDAGGNILTSTDPAGQGFAAVNAEGSVMLSGLSCPTTERCVAVTNNADVLTSTDPTGGPQAWTFENLVPFEAAGNGASIFVKNALWGASCPSPSLCVLVGAASRIFTSTAPFAAPGPSPAKGAEKRGRLRPRTIIVFAEPFWKYTTTRRHRTRAQFRFYSKDGARHFLCRPDRRRWRRCHSPLRYWVPKGRHVLRVRAVGRTGLRGPVSSLRFEVRRPGQPFR
jgi:hypothetical protein